MWNNRWIKNEFYTIGGYIIMNGIKRSALIGSLLVGVLVSAGCGEGHLGITINSDGSVDARD